MKECIDRVDGDEENENKCVMLNTGMNMTASLIHFISLFSQSRLRYPLSFLLHFPPPSTTSIPPSIVLYLTIVHYPIFMSAHLLLDNRSEMDYYLTIIKYDCTIH